MFSQFASLDCCNNIMFHLCSLTSPFPPLLPSYVLIKASCNFCSCCLFPVPLILLVGISPMVNPSFLADVNREAAWLCIMTVGKKYHSDSRSHVGNSVCYLLLSTVPQEGFCCVVIYFSFFSFHFHSLTKKRRQKKLYLAFKLLDRKMAINWMAQGILLTTSILCGWISS